MSNKYFGGIVTQTGEMGQQSDTDANLKECVTGTVGAVTKKMDELRVADAITEIFNLFKRCNKYIDETEPWKLAKDETQNARLSEVLYNLTEGISTGASLLAPYMPETTQRILKQLNSSPVDYDRLSEWGNYPSGNKVTDSPEILFMRMDLKDVLEKAHVSEAPDTAKTEENGAAGKKDAAQKASAEKAGKEETAGKPEVVYEDFDRLEFRVGEILECRSVENSKKLLCSQVKIGDKVVQICSGIRSAYTPEQMVGRKVMVITNLKPRKMAGLDSQGMLLCAEDQEGKLSLMTPDDSTMAAGSEIC